MEFGEVRETVFSCHARGEFTEAMTAIDSYVGSDDEQSDLTFWRMCLLSQLGRGAAATTALEEGLDSGLWWAEILLSDGDLEAARSDPRWTGLVARSQALAERANEARPDPLVLEPITISAKGTIVYFHGAGTHPRYELPHFEAAAERGFRRVALFGSQALSTSRWMWHADVEHEAGRVSEALDRFDAPILLAGFSQGAKIAAKLAWMGMVEVAGVMLVAPSFHPDDSQLLAQARHVPSWILTGTEDGALESTRRVASVLAAASVPLRVDVRTGLGHSFPNDYSTALLETINWILAHDAR